MEASLALQRQGDCRDNMGRSLVLSDVDFDGMFNKSLLPWTVMVIPFDLEDVLTRFYRQAIHCNIRVRISMVDCNKVQLFIQIRVFFLS